MPNRFLKAIIKPCGQNTSPTIKRLISWGAGGFFFAALTTLCLNHNSQSLAHGNRSMFTVSSPDTTMHAMTRSGRNIFRRVNNAWQVVPGIARDIGIGSSGVVWVVGDNAVPGGFGIYRWSGHDWQAIEGGAINIAVDPSGNPWVVNDQGQVFQRVNNTWRLIPGIARDIGIGANGSVWVIGDNAVPGGFGLYRWTGRDWQAIEGGAVRIAVDPSGNPWVVNDRGQVFQRENNAWRLIPGIARDIGIGADGSVWVVGDNPVPGGFGLYRWTGRDWQAIEGGAIRIAVDPSGNPWVTNQ